MPSFKSLRSHLSRWLRISSPGTSKLPAEPRPIVTTMPTTLFFYPHKIRQLDSDSGIGSSRAPTICTPDSSRSVYFDDASSWPFIDADDSEST